MSALPTTRDMKIAPLTIAFRIIGEKVIDHEARSFLEKLYQRRWMQDTFILIHDWRLFADEDSRIALG